MERLTEDKLIGRVREQVLISGREGTPRRGLEEKGLGG
jgi:hypothetical protein